WAGLARCYEGQARYAEAAACYSTCIALSPRLSWLAFKRGVVFLHLGNYAEARADFDEFLGARPDVPEAYVNRALALQGLKDDARAVEDLTKALELGTTQTRVYFIRSRLRARLGDRDGARRDRAKGLELEPTDELSWVVRGTAKLSADPRGALADFDRALRLNPRSLDGLQNKASVLAEQLGRTADAVDVLNQAVPRYPPLL